MGLWDIFQGLGGAAGISLGQAEQMQQYQNQQQGSLQGQHPYQSQLSPYGLANAQSVNGLQGLRGTTQAPMIAYTPIVPIAISHFITQKILIVWEP